MTSTTEPVNQEMPLLNLAPLGPDSLTWRLLGDVRNIFLLVYTGALQGLHPAIGSALVHQSTAFTDPWNRLWRSSHQILGTVYDEDADLTAHRVRAYHNDVKGTASDGRPYHSLNPGPFVWAHTTFVWAMTVAAETFGTPLTLGEKEQLWAEGRQWYARYGLGMREVPLDWAAAEKYVSHMIEHELVNVEAGALAIRSVTGPTPQVFPQIPQPLWNKLGPRIGSFEVWVANALAPQILRDRLCLQWSRRDAVVFAVFRGAVRAGFVLTPRRYRYLPRAAQAWRRVLAQ